MMRLRAKVLTVSDGVACGERQDSSGAALEKRLEEAGFEVAERTSVPDGVEPVREALLSLTDEFIGVVVTTGGTGFAPRDLTPEGTLSVLERQAPGMSEAMRLASPLGRLSRGVAGTLRSSIVLNTPGSPRGALECIEAVLDVLPHAMALIAEQPAGH